MCWNLCRFWSCPFIRTYGSEIFIQEYLTLMYGFLLDFEMHRMCSWKAGLLLQHTGPPPALWQCQSFLEGMHVLTFVTKWDLESYCSIVACYQCSDYLLQFMVVLLLLSFVTRYLNTIMILFSVFIGKYHTFIVDPGVKGISRVYWTALVSEGACNTHRQQSAEYSTND